MTVVSQLSCGNRIENESVEGNVWVLADVLLVFPGFL